MANIMNSGINGHLPDLLNGFGTQLHDNLKEALLGLCSDLEIDASTFKKAWDDNYASNTGLFLGDAIVIKKTHKPVLKEKGMNAYQCYIKAWKHAKDAGTDDRTFADVRSDWKKMTDDAKAEWKNSESNVKEPSPVASEPEDDSIPSIDSVKLIAKNWTVKRLKEELKKRSMNQTGKKDELIEKLVTSLSGEDEEDEEESGESSSESDSSGSSSDEELSDEEEDVEEDVEDAVASIINDITE